MTLSICIFAHNEQRNLANCVGSLDGAAAGRDYQAHILVNGCTDETAALAKALAAADARIAVHESTVADKVTAWNDYMFRIAEPAAAHIFLDGDSQASAGSFAALEDALEANPNAYAAAALPLTGRSRRAWAERLIMNQYLSGNLYALSHECITMLRAREIHLPYGAKGEDGLISYLLLTDLKGGEDDSHRHRIVTATGATFEFDSLGGNFEDIKTFHRRLLRYAERHFQKQILYRLLKRDGVSAMPDNIYEIYTHERLSRLKPRKDMLNYWFDRAALRKLHMRDYPGAPREI